MAKVQILFPDKAKKPNDAAIEGVLGRNKKQWDALIAYATQASPDAKPEWKHYGKSSGWVFLLRGKKRVLLYLRPLEKKFAISLAFNDAAVDAARTSDDLPADLVKSIVESPKYPEGRMARMEVKTAKDASVAKKLVDIKIGS